MLEWIENRGWNIPFCTHLTNNSSSGAGPQNPPISHPLFATPDNPMFRTVAMLYLMVFHSVKLSPDHVEAYFWKPAYPDLLMMNGRMLGFV